MQERKNLNHGIEDAYVATAYYSSCIQNYYENQMGVVKESYEYFFLNLAYLVRLTQCLEELAKDKKTIDEVKSWLDSEKDKDMKARWKTGDTMFLKYASLLSARGLLALPSKR
jgi:hypothetical protein